MVTVVRNPLELAEEFAFGQQAAFNGVVLAQNRFNQAEFDSRVETQTIVGGANVATSASGDVQSLQSDGVLLRIPAGGSAQLDLTGLGDWHYDDARLSIMPLGKNMALPFVMDRSEPGPDGAVVAYTWPFTPPRYMGALVFRDNRTPVIAPNYYSPVYSNGVLSIENNGEPLALGLTMAADDNSHTTQEEYLGVTVNKITLIKWMDHGSDPMVTAILPNVAENLGIRRADDSILHQFSRHLRPDDGGESGDISDHLNDRIADGENNAMLRISSRTDCVLSIKLAMTRRHLAEGATDDIPAPLVLNAWQPRILQPNLANGAGATVTLAAEVKASGPAQTGLREPALLTACQGVRLPTRVSLLQPFTLPNVGDGARRFSGVWLCLSGPAAAQETVQVQIVAFEPDKNSIGETLAQGTAKISDRQMDLIPIGGGQFAHWMDFETELAIDIPDLNQPMGLVLSQASGPIPLLECSRTLTALDPALWRDFSRSDRWQLREFGGPDKAVLFDLGETSADLPATLTIKADSAAVTVDVSHVAKDIAVTVPGATELTLSADRQVTLEAINLTSTTPAQ